MMPGLVWIQERLPGVMVCGVVALSATFLSEHHGGPQLLYALLIGLSLNFLHAHPRLACGVGFCGRTVLRVGVALLGARITFSQIGSLGLRTAVIVCAATLLTILFGVFLARVLSRSRQEGVLSGCAVGICGASAALAISAVLPQTRENERFTLLAVVGVTLLSTLAMVLYPLGVHFLHFTPDQAGIFLGATIHDVAQVAAAGMLMGDQTAETAVIVKLFRVALLMPISMAVAMAYRKAQVVPSDGTTPHVPLFPAFLVAFVVLVAVSSSGIVPARVMAWSSDASRWMLVIAIAAAGIKTSFADLSQLGWKPVLMLGGETVFLALIVLAALLAG